MGVSLLERLKKFGDLGRSKVGTDSDGYETEKAGMVQACQKKRWDCENIWAVAEMKMEGKRPRGRPKLRLKDTIRRDLKAWNIREEWDIDRERQKRSLQAPLPRTGSQRRRWERWENSRHSIQDFSPGQYFTSSQGYYIRIVYKKETINIVREMRQVHNSCLLSAITCDAETWTVFCPRFQKGRVPSEKGTLARWTDRQKGTLARWTDRQKGPLARWTEEKGHN